MADPIHIAALLEVAPQMDNWDDAGRLIGTLIEASLDADDDARVALAVSAYSKEEVELSIADGLIRLRVPRWQLERALEMTRGGRA